MPRGVAGRREARRVHTVQVGHVPSVPCRTVGRRGGEDARHHTEVRPTGTGYADPPAGVTIGQGLHYNPYFAGGQIAMAPPLSAGQVQFADDTEASVKHMAADVTAFLTWTAEPKLEDRKRLGFKVMLFLIVLTGLFYMAKQRVWRGAH